MHTQMQNPLDTYESKADAGEDHKASPEICEYDEGDYKHSHQGEAHVTEQFLWDHLKQRKEPNIVSNEVLSSQLKILKCEMTLGNCVKRQTSKLL